MNNTTLTACEKRNFKLWELMRVSKSFFNIKELEKLASKCGIRSVSIKETIKWLLDENMIMQNKMGSFNVYWTLASEEYSSLERKKHNLQNSLNRDLETLAAEEERFSELLERVNDLSNKTDEKTPKKAKKNKNQIFFDNLPGEKISEKLQENRKELYKCRNTLGKLDLLELYSFDTLQSEIDLATSAINRWNDNILAVKYWFCKHINN